MKKSFVILLAFISLHLQGQVPINDGHVINQQRRMVMTAWDSFTPDAGRIFGIPTNPLWWATWGFHQDYHKTDRRPLSATGPQTKRMGYAILMHTATKQYEKEQEAIRNTALKEIVRISGDLSAGDPLYLLYYKGELEALTANDKGGAFTDLNLEEFDYMAKTGSVDWFNLKYQALQESYEVAKSADMERGQRMLMYHRIMLDMQKLYNNWEYKKRVAITILDISKRTNEMKAEKAIFNPTRGYKEILDEIMKNTKTLKE